MCGIAGSSSFDKAFDLYEKNLKRGYFSSGFLSYDEKGNILIKKQKEKFNKEDLFKDITYNLIGPVQYLFHSRAPTNSKEPFSEATCHPFDFDNYYVSHNGIITNFKSFPEHPEFTVDSSIIPYHLTKNNGDIKKTFEAYEGLLTCWIYNHLDGTTRIVKAGSSLYMDDDSFSSVPFKGAQFIEEDGIVFWYYQDKIMQITNSTFKYDNPYEL